MAYTKQQREEKKRKILLKMLKKKLKRGIKQSKKVVKLEDVLITVKSNVFGNILKTKQKAT